MVWAGHWKRRRPRSKKVGAWTKEEMGEEQKGTRPTFLQCLELRVYICCTWNDNASSSFVHHDPQMIRGHPSPPTGYSGIFKTTIAAIQQEGILWPWMMEELGFSQTPQGYVALASQKEEPALPLPLPYVHADTE